MTEESKPGPDPKVNKSSILDLFRETTDPVLSTAEVTEQVPLKRRAVYNRLTSLAEEGCLESKLIGGRNTVWWLAESERPETRLFSY